MSPNDNVAKGWADQLKEWMLVVAIIGGTLLFLTGPLELARQCFQWLKLGAWEPLLLSDALRIVGVRYPQTDYVGLQKILDWVLSREYWWSMPGLVILAVWAGYLIVEANRDT